MILPKPSFIFHYNSQDMHSPVTMYEQLEAGVEIIEELEKDLVYVDVDSGFTRISDVLPGWKYDFTMQFRNIVDSLEPTERPRKYILRLDRLDWDVVIK